MIKRVYKNRGVIREYFSHDKNHARNSSKTLWFKDGTLYSYQTPIAWIVNKDIFDNQVLINNEGYSNTTKKHVSMASSGSNFKDLNRVNTCFFKDKLGMDLRPGKSGYNNFKKEIPLIGKSNLKLEEQPGSRSSAAGTVYKFRKNVCLVKVWPSFVGRVLNMNVGKMTGRSYVVKGNPRLVKKRFSDFIRSLVPPEMVKKAVEGDVSFDGKWFYVPFKDKQFKERDYAKHRFDNQDVWYTASKGNGRWVKGVIRHKNSNVINLARTESFDGVRYWHYAVRPRYMPIDFDEVSGLKSLKELAIDMEEDPFHG